MTSAQYKKYVNDNQGKRQQEERLVPCAKKCDSGTACGKCPVWKELSENKEYRQEGGVEIPTMGGRAENLLFRFKNEQVHVWRKDGQPEFKFNQSDCHALCRRYKQGLEEKVFQPTKLGGTTYFVDPAWEKPILERHPTPYAAAVIRHIWIVLNLPYH